MVAAVAGLAALAGCSPARPSSAIGSVKAVLSQVASVPPRNTTVAPANPTCGKPPAGRYVGISVDGYTQHPQILDNTLKTWKITPSTISMYYNFGQEIDGFLIRELCTANRLPLVEIDTSNMPLSRITSGLEDPVIQSYALKFGTLGVPMVIDFDHEFNGPWFDWGYTHTTAPEFVAAWRRIVTIFRENGATNVMWVWNPNVDGRVTTANLQAWYPGDAYVNWVGLDGYFYIPSDTFASVFYPTLNQIRQFTKLPWFIVETGANPGSGRVRAINSIFSGAAHASGLLGLIWFDYNKYKNHNWNLDNDPTGLAAFRSGQASYQQPAK
jgi:hypothetical protein